MKYKLIILIIITIFFFSTSSILARAALAQNNIDAFTFTFFRLFSGALVLLIILYIKEKKLNLTLNKNWTSSFMLFLYAIAFSYSYLNLDAGIGALILFAVVQLFIIFIALLKKERLTIEKGLGITLAFMGLIYLLLPQESFELSFTHVCLMILSGLAWGAYTILGKRSSNALLNTTDNFTKSLVFTAIFYLLFGNQISYNFEGILLAIISGGITSAIGYTMWYYILPKIETLTSGVLQLLIPPIAIFLSVIFLDEELSFKLIISLILILLGIFIALKNRKKRVN